MNTLERDIKTFILRALLAARDLPVTDDTLKLAISNAFRHVALTTSELNRYVRDCDEAALIAGTNDEIYGVMWALTPKGKIRAQQL
jgi:hypothetical protein